MEVKYGVVAYVCLRSFKYCLSRISLEVQVRGCFTSTETIKTIRDRDPRTSTSSFTQCLSVCLSVRACILLAWLRRCVRAPVPNVEYTDELFLFYCASRGLCRRLSVGRERRKPPSISPRQCTAYLPLLISTELIVQSHYFWVRYQKLPEKIPRISPALHLFRHRRSHVHCMPPLSRVCEHRIAR